MKVAGFLDSTRYYRDWQEGVVAIWALLLGGTTLHCPIRYGLQSPAKILEVHGFRAETSSQVGWLLLALFLAPALAWRLGKFG